MKIPVQLADSYERHGSRRAVLEIRETAGQSVVLTPAVGLGPLSSPDPGVDGGQAEAPESLWFI